MEKMNEKTLPICYAITYIKDKEMGSQSHIHYESMNLPSHPTADVKVAV